MNKQEIMAKCDAAAEAIATLPVEQWPGWAVYLLEALDTKARDQGHRADVLFGASTYILGQVGEALKTRQKTGLW